MAQVKFFRGVKANYDSVVKHLNAIYFATDTQELLMGNKAYGMSSSNADILNSAFVNAQFVTPTTVRFSRTGSNNYVDVDLPVASESQAGFMSAASFSKLNNVEAGAQVNVIENVIVDGIGGTINGKTLAINGGFAKADAVYTKEEVNNEIAAKLSSVYEYKDSVATYSDLPTTGVDKGDVYNVEAEYREPGIDGKVYPAGTNWAWNGTEWDALGGLVDLTGIKSDITTNANAIITNANAISDEKDRAEGIEGQLRTDLGTKNDVADKDGSAFARIANLASLVSDMTGGSTTSIAQQIADAKAELKGNATTEGDTLGKLEGLIAAEAQTARAAEGANARDIEAEAGRAAGEESRIEGLVTAEVTRATGVESGLDSRLQAAEGLIAKLDGADTVEGSVKKQIKDAVQAEADRATGVENGLANRIKTLEAAVGEDGSVADAINAAVAALDADVNSTGGAKVSVNVVEVDGKITSVTVAEDDIASAQALASYKTTNDAAVAAKVATADFEDFKTTNNSAIATAKSEAITKAGENADTKISEAVNALNSSKTGDGAFVDVTVAQTNGKITSVTVSEENIASAALLGTLSDDATKNTAFGKAAAAQAAAVAADGKASANATAISNLQNNTVNGKKISENPVLTGEDITLTGYSAVTGGFIAATDTVVSAISKLENDLIWHEA